VNLQVLFINDALYLSAPTSRVQTGFYGYSQTRTAEPNVEVDHSFQNLNWRNVKVNIQMQAVIFTLYIFRCFTYT